MKIVLVAIGRVPHMGVAFKDSLLRLGHEVRLVDERWAYTLLDRGPFRWFTGPVFGGAPSARGIFRVLLLRACVRFRPDLVLAIKGSPLDCRLLEELRSVTNATFAMYSTDNPFNPAVSNRHMVGALAKWDLIATPRRANIAQLREYCPGEVFYLPFGYDPAQHHPEQPRTRKEHEKFRSDAVFVGACDNDRVPYLDLLARAEDMSVRFHGGNYCQTPALAGRDRGYVYGRDYRLAITTTAVAICLVRRANADGHVMRTFEIPACGAFLLAERTPDHSEMFAEDEEAVFFSEPEELVSKARFYIRCEAKRNQITRRGYERVTTMPNTYRDRLAQLLRHI